MAGAENKLTKHDQMMYNQGRYFFICPVFRFLGGMSWHGWDVAGAFECGLRATNLAPAGFMKVAKLPFFVKRDDLCSIYCFLCKCYSVFKACSGQNVRI